MYREEELSEKAGYYEKMKSIFASLDILGVNTSGRINFLQRFGAMHVGALVGEYPKCRFQSDEISHYREVQKLIADPGLPADWAFTVFNLFPPVHSWLIKKENEHDATLFRNFILQNYAYKLRGVKRVAFMASFFASMHYDFTESKNIDDARNLSRYVITKFDRVPEPEFRIYVTFTRLIMADVETSRIRDDHSAEELIKLFRDAKLQDCINEIGLQSLWRFLNLYKEMIENNLRLEFEKMVHRRVLVPECRVRWRKAICASRHHEKFLYGNRSLFVDRWYNRLHKKRFKQESFNVYV